MVNAGIRQLPNTVTCIDQAAAYISFIQIEFVLFIEATNLQKSGAPKGAVGALKIREVKGQRKVVKVGGSFPVPIGAT